MRRIEKIGSIHEVIVLILIICISISCSSDQYCSDYYTLDKMLFYNISAEEIENVSILGYEKGSDYTKVIDSLYEW